MPETGKNTSSGSEPEEKKLTIIGGGGGKEKKPTVIAGQPASKVTNGSSNSLPLIPNRPTVIGSNGEKPAQVAQKSDVETVVKITPTTIISREGKLKTNEPKAGPVITKFVPKPTDALSEKKSAVVEKPSLMPGGVVRKAVEIEQEELFRHFPGTPGAVLEHARQLLGQVVMETLKETECLKWGMELQQRYSELVQESLVLSSHKVIQDSSRHIVRLFSLLREVASSFQEKDTGFSFWKKKDDPWEKFQEVQPEIIQLSVMLNKQIPIVVDIRAQLDAISRGYAVILTELDAASIAAKYLSDRMDTSEKQQTAAQCLLSRSLSLTQAVAQIHQGEVMRQSTIQEIDRLIIRIQDGVLLKLPAWIEQVSVFQMKTSLTDTDMYTCRQGIEEIINQMQ